MVQVKIERILEMRLDRAFSLVETFFISFSRIEITISEYNVQVYYKFVADKKLFVFP